MPSFRLSFLALAIALCALATGCAPHGESSSSQGPNSPEKVKIDIPKLDGHFVLSKTISESQLKNQLYQCDGSQLQRPGEMDSRIQRGLTIRTVETYAVPVSESSQIGESAATKEQLATSSVESQLTILGRDQTSFTKAVVYSGWGDSTKSPQPIVIKCALPTKNQASPGASGEEYQCGHQYVVIGRCQFVPTRTLKIAIGQGLFTPKGETKSVSAAIVVKRELGQFKNCTKHKVGQAIRTQTQILTREMPNLLQPGCNPAWVYNSKTLTTTSGKILSQDAIEVLSWASETSRQPRAKRP